MIQIIVIKDKPVKTILKGIQCKVTLAIFAIKTLFILIKFKQLVYGPKIHTSYKLTSKAYATTNQTRPFAKYPFQPTPS